MNKKLRVLHYVTGFAETSGGIESFLFNMLRSFENENSIQNTLLTRYCYRDSAFFKKFEEAGFSITSLEIKHLGLKEYYKFSQKLNNFFANNHFDILHVHGTDEPLIISIAQKHGIKNIVLHSHSTGIEMNGRKKWTKSVKNIWRKSNIRKASYYLGCSKDVLDEVFSGVKSIRKRVISNAIDTSIYRFSEYEREQVRAALGIEENTCLIGHVGRMVNVKNQELILTLAKRAKELGKDFKFVFVGDGSDFIRIRDLAEDLDVEKNVVFLGERSDVPILLNGFDVFVFPSKFEGLGMTVVEAQANGLPCVISDVIPDEVIVSDIVTKLSLEDTIDNWVKELESSNIREIERKRYAEIVAESGYGIERISASLKQLYREFTI